jgi:hypothetical protein
MPDIKVCRVVRLPPDDQLHVARLFKGHISLQGKPGSFKRRELVVIHNLENGRKVTREVAGNGQARVPRDGIGLDYDTWVELGLGRNQDAATIRVKSAGLFGSFLYNWNHPDKATRFATRFGALGVALGLLGFV